MAIYGLTDRLASFYIPQDDLSLTTCSPRINCYPTTSRSQCFAIRAEGCTIYSTRMSLQRLTAWLVSGKIPQSDFIPITYPIRLRYTIARGQCFAIWAEGYTEYCTELTVPI